MAANQHRRVPHNVVKMIVGRRAMRTVHIVFASYSIFIAGFRAPAPGPLPPSKRAGARNPSPKRSLPVVLFRDVRMAFRRFLRRKQPASIPVDDLAAARATPAE